MKIKLKEITVRQLTKEYEDNGEDGVVAWALFKLALLQNADKSENEFIK
tara:strand:- start:49 stop:195 length:147 start_codon:yes stop_codon:yes gene_type:complete